MRDGQRSKFTAIRHEVVFLRSYKRRVETVVIDNPFTFDAQEQRPVSGLDDQVVRSKFAKKLDEDLLGHGRERSIAAQHAPRIGRRRSAVLSNQGKNLLDQRREVQCAGVWRFAPFHRQEADRRDRLDKFSSNEILWRAAGLKFGLFDVNSRHRGFASATRSPEALT